MLEKYYCDYCRLLYETAEVCKSCGHELMNKIYIEVQNNSKPIHDKNA